jgi:hypothetical protein
VKKELAHAENPAIVANRFLIAFNTATGASVVKQLHTLSVVMNVEHGHVIR